VAHLRRAKGLVDGFNATFNKISIISWRSVLLVEETEVSGQTSSHNVVSSTPRDERDSNSQL
jgi:hypothetical protein